MEAIYALRSWTVREHRGKYQISQTAYFGERERNWSKSYGSLTQATNAIARKLQEEWTTRHNRSNGHSKKKRK